MKLEEYLDVNKLTTYISCGLVTARTHKTLPLTIYCYGRTAVYDNVWDEITTKTRGLIVDKDSLIIARPYEKFFSYATEGRSETSSRSVENTEREFGPPIITEKINGCLGTFYRYNYHWGIASKGSFHSPHAEFATKWMEDHIEKHGKFVYPKGYTPVFEIICQEIQPHVIKYDHDGLVLLNLINQETGEELGRTETFNYAKRNHLDITLLTCLNLKKALEMDSSASEGYVATYNRPGTTPLKIKIKFPTFIKNRKTFYEELKLKEQSVPDNIYQQVLNTAASIVQESLVKCTTRSEVAGYFNNEANKFYASACFAMLDYEGDREKRHKIVERLAKKLGAL